MNNIVFSPISSFEIKNRGTNFVVDANEHNITEETVEDYFGKEVLIDGVKYKVISAERGTRYMFNGPYVGFFCRKI